MYVCVMCLSVLRVGVCTETVCVKNVMCVCMCVCTCLCLYILEMVCTWRSGYFWGEEEQGFDLGSL